ncbi:hypothetical protein AB4Z17_11475, partial [Paenibacillus sp. TAF43_2]|uniref:hypothetical protein n=1 Tax=Paenibacillus sp. TAF43_2 TaxID=3233069 RepID=UPI003F962873
GLRHTLTIACQVLFPHLGKKRAGYLFDNLLFCILLNLHLNLMTLPNWAAFYFINRSWEVA